MYILLTVLVVIAAVFLVLLVLVQNSKGGGLAAGFNSGNQVMGVRRTTDFLEKATWSLVAVIVLLSVFAVGLSKNTNAVGGEQSVISEQVQMEAPAAEALPAAETEE